MEERKDGITDNGSTLGSILIEKQISPELFTAFYAQVGSKHYNEEGQPDVFRVFTTPHPTIKELTTSTSLRTTFAPGPAVGQLRCVLAGKVRILNLGGTAEAWQELADKLTARNAALGLVVPEAKEGAVAVPILDGSFNIAGGYARPIFGLSKLKKDLPLLLEFHEPQTPLNWAVGLAMFSLTNEDKVRSGDWQEATIRDIEDRVYCLTETDAPRHGQHREDILAEVVKLHTKKNWYYEIETVQVGRAWTKRATIGSQYAIPEIQFIFLDTKTGKRVFPSDPSIRALLIPLEVKGRRVKKPDGKDILSLPKGRWELESIRWRWVQSFNDDLSLTPALVESGKRKGLPKKTTTGKTIRKGYLIRVADNVFHALGRLRSEGRGSLYACRLLIMLASNLNKTEDGVFADRVFRMLGIPEDYQKRTHEKPEELVARAVLRLKERDVRALLAGSDEYPRTDQNPDRRKRPYYCFKRSPEYTPRTGIVSKEDALAIEAEYEAAPEPLALPDLKTRADQIALPGIMEDAPPIPSGSSIRAAREAAGLTLRRFAEVIGGPSFKTWSMIETGQRSESAGRIKPEVWKRVRDFISQHGKKGS
ncbi:MAG: helix-turn-helix transcriptional regulator [Smithellaceae bacterium]